MCLHGLFIDSTGIAKQHTSSSLGLYLNYKLFNGKRSFKHVNSSQFLFWYPTYGWQVSTKIKDKFCDRSYRSLSEHNILRFS